MSDIFLNPITSGGGGGDVSYTYLNIWFNTLGATPNPTPDKLALRNSAGGCSFADISGFRLRLNASGTTEPVIDFTDINGTNGYSLGPEQHGGIPCLYLKNTNQSGEVHIDGHSSVIIETGQGGGKKTFTFVGANGNVIFPTSGGISTGFITATAANSSFSNLIASNISCNTLNSSGNIVGLGLTAQNISCNRITVSGFVIGRIVDSHLVNLGTTIAPAIDGEVNFINSNQPLKIIGRNHPDQISFPNTSELFLNTSGNYIRLNAAQTVVENQLIAPTIFSPSYVLTEGGLTQGSLNTTTAGTATLQYPNITLAGGTITISGSLIITGTGIVQDINNSGFRTYDNLNSVNISGSIGIGQVRLPTDAINNISSTNVNITTRPTVELWTRDRSPTNTGTLGGSLTISGTNISYGIGFTTQGLDFRATVDNTVSAFSTWSISGMTNNASSNPAFTISLWYFQDTAAWGATTNRNIISFADLGNPVGNSAVVLNDQATITTGPRYFFSPDIPGSNGNLTTNTRQWNHYVIINDPNANVSGSQTIYVNGASAATRNLVLNLPSTDTLAFGIATATTIPISRYACVRVFNTAFTATQVTDLYNERFINPFLRTNNFLQVPETLYLGGGLNPNFSWGTNALSGNRWNLDLATDGARKLTTTTWSTGSDKRIKENIEEANYNICYDVMKQLPLKYYKYTDNFINNGVYDTHKLGWIAQEVENYFPKSIINDMEYCGIENFKTLNADQIYACMYGTIKKLMNKIERLESHLGLIEDISLNIIVNEIVDENITNIINEIVE
jgi:hypothetical protein